MADNPKAAWPKTPDGTTDWEYVFEDQSSGFIPMISQAKSPEALKMVATVILQKLFTRKNDIDERTRLIALLEHTIAAGGDYNAMLLKVGDLMREIKEERIEKARVYITRQRAGAAIDRRSGLLWKIDNLLKPAVLIPVGGLFVLLLAGLVYFMLQSTLGPIDVAEAEAQAEQAAKDEAEEAAEEAAAKEGDEAPPEPLPILFKSVRWPSANPYSTERPQYYSVVLYVMEWDHKTTICRRLPTVMDRFYTSFSEIMPSNRAPRDDETEALKKEIKGAINAMLPADYVTEVAVGRYGTRNFRIASRPPYCSSPNN